MYYVTMSIDIYRYNIIFQYFLVYFIIELPYLNTIVYIDKMDKRRMYIHVLFVS